MTHTTATDLLMGNHWPQPRVLTKLCLFEDPHPLCTAKSKHKGDEFACFSKAVYKHCERTNVAQGIGSPNVCYSPTEKTTHQSRGGWKHRHLCTVAGLTFSAILSISIEPTEM